MSIYRLLGEVNLKPSTALKITIFLMSLMSNFHEIQAQFKVFSTQPELRIRYSDPIWLKILVLLCFWPIWILFAGHCWILFVGLHELLNLRFWQAIQIFSYNTNNLWNVLFFAFTFFLLGVASKVLLWVQLGITELYATRESLTIIGRWRLLGISHETSVLANDIRYFNQFLNRSGEGDSWELEVVRNQRLSDKDGSSPSWFAAERVSADMVTRINYKTVVLYSHGSPNPSYWLGRVLADFYQVEFRSTTGSNGT